MLATFWGTAARRGWRPQFARVESKANVADAVSRDVSRAMRENWTPGRLRREHHRGPRRRGCRRRLRGQPGGGRPRERHQLSRHGAEGAGRVYEVRPARCLPVLGRDVGSRARSASMTSCSRVCARALVLEILGRSCFPSKVWSRSVTSMANYAARLWIENT